MGKGIGLGAANEKRRTDEAVLTVREGESCSELTVSIRGTSLGAAETAHQKGADGA
jgi:hypothetical protein